jgi:hypothetical protein
VTPSRGYDDLVFVYDPASFSGDDEAFESLVPILANELDAYYELARLRVEEMNAWPEVAILYEELDQLSDKPRLTRAMQNFFKKSNLIYRLTQRLIRFKSLQMGIDAHGKDIYEGVYDAGLETYLRPYVDRIRRDRATFPADQYLAFAEFLEHRRLKVWEVSVLALAALIGALIGALAPTLGSLAHSRDSSSVQSPAAQSEPPPLPSGGRLPQPKDDAIVVPK